MTLHVNDGLDPGDGDLEVVRIDIEINDEPIEGSEQDEPSDTEARTEDKPAGPVTAATNGSIQFNGFALAALAKAAGQYTNGNSPAIPASTPIPLDEPTVDEPPVEPVAETADPGAEPIDELIADLTSERAAPADSSFSMADLRGWLAFPLAVLLGLGLIGFMIGRSRGDEQVVRREFVYTLNESVPDSFLREDRRLLTQIATLESDAVLTPVAAEFDRDIDDLRDAIDVEIVDLSEVLRLEVRHSDRATAVAIGDAVFARYVLVTSTPLPTETSDSLRAQREIVVADLAEADANLLAVRQVRQDDAALLTQEESLGRQIDLKEEQVNRLQGSLDAALTSALTSTRRSNLERELATASAALAEFENQLATIRSDRAELAEISADEPPLTREIQRLESELETIDDELTQRELGPLVSSPVRTLSEPTFKVRSANRAGVEGLAAGLLVGLPIAALLGYRSRKRKHWFD